MSWGSTIPAAIDALAAAIDSTGIRVVAGPQFVDSAERPLVVVGWGGAGQDSPMVTANSSSAGFVTDVTHESYTVRCVAVVDTGSTGAEAVVATRNQVVDLFGRVASVVAADATLGGAVMRAAVADYSLTMQQHARGLTGSVEFGVAIDAQSIRKG